ncbi:MAG: transcriptional regulator [Thermoplasmata archaeon]
MPIEIESDSLEARILRILIKTYPITVSDLEWDLKISPNILQRTMKALQSRGIIELEELPDKTFIRLIRRDISFVGRKATQRKRVKRKGEKIEKSEYDGMMYG